MENQFSPASVVLSASPSPTAYPVELSVKTMDLKKYEDNLEIQVDPPSVVFQISLPTI